MSASNAGQKLGLDYDVAMRRLAYLSLLGCLIILTYGFSVPGNVVRVLSVGLMAAGAALVVGGLLGFLFGVPHTRDGESDGSQSVSEGKTSQETETAASSGTRYRHNTSLEQISDWLTKILVGVGLVEIKSIFKGIWDIAAALRNSLGVAEGAEAFIVTILVYFSLCGFIFGFLWARLYLLRWFREVDQVKALGERIDEIETRQMIDAKALALINQQLSRAPDDPEVSEEDILSAIKPTSTATKIQIFGQVQRVSEDKDAPDYDLRIQTVVAIMKALVACDVKERYHSNRAELSYALSRKKPPEIDAAEQQISAAIRIRHQLGVKGWKYYDLRRARYRIQLDSNFSNNMPSDQASSERILSDLRAAHSDPERWERWLRQEPDIQKWLQLNGIDPTRM
jgi:hypothetical protein